LDRGGFDSFEEFKASDAALVVKMQEYMVLFIFADDDAVALVPCDDTDLQREHAKKGHASCNVRIMEWWQNWWESS
jgi:hypothetical protein